MWGEWSGLEGSLGSEITRDGRGTVQQDQLAAAVWGGSPGND